MWFLMLIFRKSMKCAFLSSYKFYQQSTSIINPCCPCCHRVKCWMDQSSSNCGCICGWDLSLRTSWTAVRIRWGLHKCFHPWDNNTILKPNHGRGTISMVSWLIFFRAVLFWRIQRLLYFMHPKAQPAWKTVRKALASRCINSASHRYLSFSSYSQKEMDDVLWIACFFCVCLVASDLWAWSGPGRRLWWHS